MILNNLMEGEPISANKLISSLAGYNADGKEHGTIKALLKNFILPQTDTMAIKQKQTSIDKCVYSVPIQPTFTPSERAKSVNDAKMAFLKSTVEQIPPPSHTVMVAPTLHYAQLAVTTESGDSRSTGGGKNTKDLTDKLKENNIPKHISSNVKKKVEQQQRKVSFKTKSASASYRRPPLATKTMTITSSKVTELTKKFNDLMNDGTHNKQSKLIKTVEDLQTVTRCSASNSSTPSSTLSSSPNIKIVLRQRKSSKKRSHNKKRCSSMDSINKLVISEGSTGKIRIIRSKSDGTKIPKSPKKRLQYQDSSGQQSGSDSVDGTPVKKPVKETPKVSVESSGSLGVKNAIKKFECEISAQAINNNNNTIKRKSNQIPSKMPPKEKPKVPEKKSSLVLTKNLVVKDGIPKIKTIKPVIQDASVNKIETKQPPLDTVKTKKEPIYDRKKYKTNYIHSEKLPLHVVEIIQEDINENLVTASSNTENQTSERNYSDIYQEIESTITPNESFLWRRKSNTQIYSDSEKSTSDSVYGVVSIVTNSSTITVLENEKEVILKGESQVQENTESQMNTVQNNNVEEPNLDFESNLIEAYNKEVLVGFTSKPKLESSIEDDYEPLEPRDTENVVVISVKSDRSSKINCPLPEIPIECKNESERREQENIYQCLLEMRSHPEGDESSLHNYELCESENQLEERTRGDGDSDDGYEYCKSPVKPYCHTSSSGIQIAEGYKPYAGDTNNKNYCITKSVSGTSTVSYEKIGSERIYEKIPSRPPKSKESSPNYSKRHSYVSSDYTSYNDNENIYDTIKHGDGASLSHCYESIPNSPSMVKLRHNLKKQLSSAVQKRLSFDTVSNISQSTLSSEQKTNSIYGQRSVVSYNGQEIAFQVPSSETSVSDRSDRSDDWVDVSDEEKTEEQKIIIVRERSRGRKSPISWSQKVRHQRHKSPKQTEDKECDSSDSGHLYESLEPAPASRPAPPVPPAPAAHPAPLPLEDDFDSFDSDTDSDEHDKTAIPSHPPPALPASRLPSPPNGGGPYTLTKIASAAQRKMRQIKRNLTKRYSVALDGRPFAKSTSPLSNSTYEAVKTKTKSPIYANYERADTHTYSNISFDKPTKTEYARITGFKEELKTVINEKRHSAGDIPPPLPDKPPPEKPPSEKPPTPTSDVKKDGTLSRKAYFSFKSRFRRATSMAVDINSDVPSALKITNSTFYLTDSMDGDSGFSNCSDTTQAGSSEALPGVPGAGPPGQPGPPGPAGPPGPPGAAGPGRRRDGKLRGACSEPALERPAVPPPPPPAPHHTDLSAVNEELKRLLPTLSRKDKGARTRTSWYAECGADTASVNTSSTSWYAESGLYQAGTASTSSGASSGSHPASPLPHSLFTHEPLYQFYNAAKVESACRETGDSDSDAYEASGAREAGPGPARPSAMALVAPRGPARTLWCEVPEVVNSAVLSSLAPAQKRLQEAKFELLTSEASYLNSLNVLESHFIAHPAFRDPQVLPPEDWETLFSTILPVRKCSQALMTELERCWQENILLGGICDIVRRHAERRFRAYVKYCENQALMVRTLQRLRDQPAFAAALKRIESQPACQSLSLHSFLMLPMQRVTRLPLLLDAVLRNLAPADHEYDGCMHALATLNDFVSQCNEGARNTERVEEMFRLARAIDFPDYIRDPPALGPACSRRDRKPVRWLVRSGEMTQLVWKADELKLTFGKKFHKVPLHLFLFNDHLVITKKKGPDQFVCVEHCARSLLEVCASDCGAAKHALLLTLLENRDGRTVEMLMSCPSETDARRWGEALSPVGGEAGGEAVYAGWDCPQVAAQFAYRAAQPDELPLHPGDVINVTRKTSEGWYYGERTRDGEAGWFPGAYTVEIMSPHVRARNLRQRYRLLALSGTYLGQKKRP